MDAHAFNILSKELLRLADGARVEKIHSPSPGLLVIRLFNHGRKHHLMFVFSRQKPLVFLLGEGSQPPENPKRPTGEVMRLRKYLLNRRLGAGCADWPRRRLAFPVPGQPFYAALAEDPAGISIESISEIGGSAGADAMNEAMPGASGMTEHLMNTALAGADTPPVSTEPAPPGETADARDPLWLLVDMREGVSLARNLPDDFGEPPLWPDEGVLRELFQDDAETPSLRVQYPVLTPLLRHTLKELDMMEGLALVMDLQADNDALFAYQRNGRPHLYSAWPLPAAQAEASGLTPWEPDTGDSSPAQVTPAAKAFSALFPALALASMVSEAVFFHDFGQARQKEAEKPGQKKLKKMARLLNALKAEEKKLTAMTALKDDARLIQANLWRLENKEAKLAEITLPKSTGCEAASEDAERKAVEHTVKLDPRLSVMQNMKRMFHQAVRGARGLAMLEPRMKTAMANLEAVKKQLEGGVPAGELPAQEAAKGKNKKKKVRDLKDIARFISSDGYVMLRGKNAKGNHSLLRLGQPYDIWMHAETGPSAHLVIRRAHGADEVPERTLREAAALVGLKSPMQGEARMPVMYAYLRHIQPIKGAAPGTVRVAKIENTLLAPLDAGLEALLLAPEDNTEDIF